MNDSMNIKFDFIYYHVHEQRIFNRVALKRRLGGDYDRRFGNDTVGSGNDQYPVVGHCQFSNRPSG